MTDSTKNKKLATTEAQNDSETQKLRSEIQSLQEKCKEHLDGWKRAKADYINREREIEKDKNIWMEFITLDFILKILPIAENFERLLEHYKKPATTETQKNSESQKNSEIQSLQGVEQIKKQFDDLLKGLGIEKIKTIGEKFNPEFHEAVGRSSFASTSADSVSVAEVVSEKEVAMVDEEATEDKGSVKDNIIVEEVAPGYMMGGKAVKPAKVIVK